MLFGVRGQVYGGAVYMGEGNLSLLSPRWRSNRAHCAASLGSACTHDADDVRPNPTQPSWLRLILRRIIVMVVTIDDVM